LPPFLCNNISFRHFARLHATFGRSTTIPNFLPDCRLFFALSADRRPATGFIAKLVHRSLFIVRCNLCKALSVRSLRSFRVLYRAFRACAISSILPIMILGLLCRFPKCRFLVPVCSIDSYIHWSLSEIGFVWLCFPRATNL
jgi:hypothetical protein